MLRLLLLFPLLLVSGCSWLFGEDGLFPDNTERYKDSVELSELEIPPNLPGANTEAIYPIPDVQAIASLETDFEVPRPTPLTAGSQFDSVRIQRLGDDSWALVAVAPGQLWPQVRAFLNASQIAVASSDAQSGLIDTQFVTLTDRPLPTRFRFRVETGIQRNTSELHVLQQDRATTDVPWPAASDDADLEASMLRNVAQFIANSAEAAPVSMIADRAMGDSGRIYLEDDEDLTRLRLDLTYPRAWASVEKALPESGFIVDDKNRSAGMFYLTFQGPQKEDEGGWFDWLWGGEDEHPLKGHQYELKLSEAAEKRMYITLAGPQGSDVERREQQALLTILKGNIN